MKTGDMLPFHVKNIPFYRRKWIIFFAGFENDEQKQFFEELFLSLSYTGIGGKKEFWIWKI